MPKKEANHTPMTSEAAAPDTGRSIFGRGSWRWSAIQRGEEHVDQRLGGRARVDRDSGSPDHPQSHSRHCQPAQAQVVLMDTPVFINLSPGSTGR